MANKTTVEIDGKNQGAILSINGVKSELKGLGDYVGGPFGASMNMLSKHLAFAGVAAGIGALTALTKQAINSADEISKMSQKIGVSTESLSTLKYVADLSDVSFDQLGTSLKKLSSNLYDVSKGVGQTVSYAFNDMGIEVTDVNGKLRATEDVLLEVADKFSKMSDGTQKTALAVKIFGKAGSDMIPMLNQGKDGIKALTDEAEKLGLQMSSEFARNAEAFNDNLTTMGYLAQGIGLNIAEQLLPTLFSLSSGLVTLATNTEIAATSGQGLAVVLKSIATVLGGIYAGAYTAGTAIGTFGAAVATLVSTGSFTQAGNVFKLGWEKIENAAMSFGESFTNLWSDNTQAYKDFISTLQGGEMPLVTQAQNLEKYVKYIDILAERYLKRGFEDIITNMPNYDMSQIAVVQSDPFANIKTDAEAFFDYYSERGALMREQTSAMFGNMEAAAGMFYQASGQKAKQWFQIQKSFGIAQALMNTYEGATKALAQGGFFGIAMAATVIAAGLANVAMIASQQPASSGTGGARGVRTGGYAGESSLNNNAGTGNYNPAQNINYNIIVNGSIVDHNKFAREILPALNTAAADGVA